MLTTHRKTHATGLGENGSTLCYDPPHSQARVGIVLRVLTALLLLLPATAVVADTPSHEVWHSTVKPPRPALPTVTVELGYPGPYVSPDSSPITLRATGGDLPFDGYIGFHYSHNGAQTFNTPVITRANIGPHQTWSFRTKSELRYFGPFKREVVIDWLDRSANILAAQSAGVPPWSARTKPLHVIPARAVPEATGLEGVDDTWAAADSLPDIAWWYGGFRALMISVADWIDLPRRTREAIFASGIHVIFSGLPRSAQQMDAIDQALLPVTFESRPGAYQLPWPYASANSAPVAVPMTWHPKAGATSTGALSMPYIVSSQTATWAADGTAIAEGLPAFGAGPIVRGSYQGSETLSVRLPLTGDVIRSFTPFLVSVLTVVLAVILWVLMRRAPRRALALIAIAASVTILMARNRIRPVGAAFGEQAARDSALPVFIYDARTPVAPGVLIHHVFERMYGASPLPERKASPDTLRTFVTRGDQNGRGAEMRDASTAAGWGTLVHRPTWDAASRLSERRELGAPPLIRVRARDANHLVLDYESPTPVDSISAAWVQNDTQSFGAINTGGSNRGTATIENAHLLWTSELAGFENPFSNLAEESGLRSSITVSLFEKNRAGIRRFDWTDPFPSGQKPASFIVFGPLTNSGDGSRSSLIALPISSIGPHSIALISVPKALDATDVSASCAIGSMLAKPTGRDGTTYLTTTYEIPPEMLHQIIRDGGILRVSLRSSQAPPASVSMGFPQLGHESVSIEVWEKP